MRSPDKIRVGEIRPTQSLYTYGVGAIVDLPKFAVVVMGLDDWRVEDAEEVEEPRLLAAVQQAVGKQVDRLRAAPITKDQLDGTYASDDALIGLPVAAFPRWLRCPACGTLAPLKSPVFQFKPDKYRFDRSRFVHHNCNKAGGGPGPDAIPARFMVACRHGHLDDFPWAYFVHKGASCPGERPMLAISERGVTGEAADIYVRCKTCDASRPMSDAFGSGATLQLPRCRGRRPHLRDVDPEGCNEDVKTLALGASNSWFAMTRSALSIPAAKDPVADLVNKHWSKLLDVEDVAELKVGLKKGWLPGELSGHSAEDLFAAIEARRKGGSNDDSPSDLKAPEWKVFTSGDEAWTGSDFRDFKLRRVAVPRTFGSLIEDVVLVERLREVTALLGFTRIESGYEGADTDKGVKRAPLSRNPPTFLPAAEVRGEGFFFRIRESVMADWVDKNARRREQFEDAHRAWREKRGIELPSEQFPGMRYILLHTLSHALMRQLALECGYSAASIRERIYARDPEEEGGPMAGILFYTAAPDAEGTLGGLVSLGEPDQLNRHLIQALEDAKLCGSDPLCSEHRPDREGYTIKGAACHACMFAPETSCERSNLYLDRSLLARTLDESVEPFFL